jgi:hypothetical protein
MLNGLRILKLILCSALLLLSASLAAAQTPIPQVDSDHDGLSDDFEQRLLEKFQPTFMISASDCAGKPASFQPAVTVPTAMKQDGTIYGQVFPVSKNAVEVHYYTLWERDCGRISHPLDAEHIAALVSLAGQEPRPLYWYAGAHEKTMCDISSGARSTALDAVDRGPRVWSSSGKHALYLREDMCQSGCGADSCVDNSELPRVAAIVNLGELDAPVNGSVWINSSLWMLRDKMHSDFPPEVIARLDATTGDSVITLRGSSTVRGTIQGSDTVLGAAGTGAQHTQSALDTADTHTSNSLRRAANATGRSLRRAWNAATQQKSN